MTKLYTRNVDVFKIKVKHHEESESNPKFQDLILHEDLIDGDLKIKGKFISYHLLEKNDKYIIGLVETNRDDNIPARKKRKEKVIVPMDFPEGDGLVFGNVFLYDIKREVIFYEVNKNGSILNHFFDFIYRKLYELKGTYSIQSFPVLTGDQYEKLQKMSSKTKIELEVGFPKLIVEDFVKNKSTFYYLFNKGAKLSSTKIKVSFSVNAIHDTPLSSKEADRTIEEINDLIQLEKAELEHLKVYGYIDNEVDNKIQTIDLISQRLKGTIQLREPRLAENLLDHQRSSQIKQLYQKLEDELIKIFK